MQQDHVNRGAPDRLPGELVVELGGVDLRFDIKIVQRLPVDLVPVCNRALGGAFVLDAYTIPPVLKMVNSTAEEARELASYTG